MSPEPPKPAATEADHAIARLFGVMLMVVGVLIMTLSGLCSLGVVGVVLVEMVRSPSGAIGAVSGIPVVLIFGGVPLAIGFGVFALGRGLHRGGQRKIEPKTFD